MAFYNSGYDSAVAAKYSKGLLLNVKPNFLKQGGLQIAGTFTSLGMATIFGLKDNSFIIFKYLVQWTKI